MRSRYKRVTYNGKKDVYEHRAVWMEANGSIPEGMEVDHKNGNPRDNHIDNLRLLPHALNQVNSNTSYGAYPRGVTIQRNKSGNAYVARMSIKGKVKHIGSFRCPTAAHFAYLKAREALYPGLVHANA